MLNRGAGRGGGFKRERVRDRCLAKERKEWGEGGGQERDGEDRCLKSCLGQEREGVGRGTDEGVRGHGGGGGEADA